jgi:CHRD domain
MGKLTAAALAGVILTLAVAALALAAAKATVWTAPLSAGQEIPKQVVKDANAHGLFKGTLTGSKLKWKLTFSKLTGPATAAHIHMAKKGVAGAVVVPLCAPCKTGQSGTAKLSASLMSAFKKHLLYVNVHTAKNPAGEIRGQLVTG